MNSSHSSNHEGWNEASLPCVPPGPLVFEPGCRIMPGDCMVRFQCKCGYTTQCCIMCYANVVSSGMNISDPVLVHKSSGSRHTYDMLMAGPNSKFAAYYRRSFGCHKCAGGSMLVMDGGVTWPALLLKMPGQCLPRPTNYPTACTHLQSNVVEDISMSEKPRAEPQAASKEDEERAERRRREKQAREEAEIERINAELAARKAQRDLETADQGNSDSSDEAVARPVRANARPAFTQASFSGPRKTRVILLPIKKNANASSAAQSPVDQHWPKLGAQEPAPASTLPDKQESNRIVEAAPSSRMPSSPVNEPHGVWTPAIKSMFGSENTQARQLASAEHVAATLAHDIEHVSRDPATLAQNDIASLARAVALSLAPAGASSPASDFKPLPPTLAFSPSSVAPSSNPAITPAAASPLALTAQQQSFLKAMFSETPTVDASTFGSAPAAESMSSIWANTPATLSPVLPTVPRCIGETALQQPSSFQQQMLAASLHVHPTLFQTHQPISNAPVGFPIAPANFSYAPASFSSAPVSFPVAPTSVPAQPYSVPVQPSSLSAPTLQAQMAPAVADAMQEAVKHVTQACSLLDMVVTASPLLPAGAQLKGLPLQIYQLRLISSIVANSITSIVPN